MHHFRNLSFPFHFPLKLHFPGTARQSPILGLRIQAISARGGFQEATTPSILNKLKETLKMKRAVKQDRKHYKKAYKGANDTV